MPAFARTLTRNWKLKLLALALAVLLWVVVSAEQVTSNWIPVPLQVRVNDPDFQLIPSSVPTEVEVRFSGPGRELWDLVVRRPPLVLSITDIDSTAATFGLDAGMVQVPSQMAVRSLDVRPGAVTLDFYRVDSRLVPVRVRITRGPGSGWALVDSLEVQPNRIRISGLEQELRGIQSIATRAVALDAADSIFSRVVPLDTSGLSGVQLSATRVRVTGRVDRVRDLTFVQIPVSAADGVAISPTEVTVRVRGTEDRLQEVSAGALRVSLVSDSVPPRIPPEGVLVPLRAEGLPAGLQPVIVPSAVRLFPSRSMMDTVSIARPSGVRDSTEVERPNPRG